MSEQEFLRADQLVPGMVCEFEEFKFITHRVEDGMTENWTRIVPERGVEFEVENYEQIELIYCPAWVDKRSAPYYSL